MKNRTLVLITVIGLLLVTSVIGFVSAQEVQAPLNADQLAEAGCRVVVQQMTDAMIANQALIGAWQQEAQRLAAHSNALSSLIEVLEGDDQIAIDIAVATAKGIVSQ